MCADKTGTQMAGESSLALRYVFTSDPNPIRASVGGANPNGIDLHIMISNPNTDPVTLQSITIEIPVGEDSARALSSDPNLPDPVPATSGQWVISSSGDTITLQTSDGTPGTISDSVLFTIENITVNDTSGVVPITITELNPPAPKASDATTYFLVKQTPDFPITNFYAKPQVLYDIDESVALYWDCSAQGAELVYSVHSDSWQPDNCLNGGNCFTCDDGQNGVATPTLNDTTTFALDVIATDSGGGRSILETLYTTVQVETPNVSGASKAIQSPYLAGRIVNLYWSATNAAYCSVIIDGTSLPENAPTDTYHTGYPILLTSEFWAHDLSLIAFAIVGEAQYNFPFKSVTVNVQPATIQVGDRPNDIAITPDGQLALVANTNSHDVTVIHLVDLTTETIPIAAERLPTLIAITPDGSLAIVTSDQYLSVIDIAKREVESQTISCDCSPADIAITPDGKLALLANFRSGEVTVVNIPLRLWEKARPIPLDEGNVGVCLAITPDGQSAIVVSQDAASGQSYVSFVDVPGRSVEQTIGLPCEGPCRVVITPHGTTALVLDNSANNVTVIDIASRQVESQVIPVGQIPQNMVITPDGKLAFVANTSSSDVTVIDIPGRRALSTTISGGYLPVGIAITPDGTKALVTNIESSTVTAI